MQAFTVSHDAYVYYASDNDPLFDVDNCEEYYNVKQVDYLDVVTQIRDEKRCLAADPVGQQQVLQVSTAQTSFCMDHPEPPPFKFDRDPMRFHVFLSAFDSGVGKLSDCTIKLNTLIEYRVGAVNHAIRGCAIVGDIEGSILFDRWGDDDKISRAIYNNLTKGHILKSALELQTLADDVKIAHITLRKMKKLGELSQTNQDFILKTSSRLTRYHQNRWRNHALDFKDQTGKYLNFAEFSDFVRRAARDACDPVYGVEEASRGKVNLRPHGSKKFGQTNNVVAGQYKKATSMRHQCPKCHGEHRLYCCVRCYLTLRVVIILLAAIGCALIASWQITTLRRVNRLPPAVCVIKGTTPCSMTNLHYSYQQ